MLGEQRPEARNRPAGIGGALFGLSLNHLVRAQQQFLRDRDPESPRCSEVNY